MHKILVVDTQALLSRAIYAFESHNYKTSTGIQVHGVYGFFKMLLKEIRGYQPKYVICCNDNKKSFRKELTNTYKEHRPNSDFRYYQSQLLLCCLHELGIPVLSVEGFEADDVIATLVRNPDFITVDEQKLINPTFRILSGDRDLLQLVSNTVSVFLWKTNGEHNLVSSRDQCKKEISVYPEQILDYKALVGDTSDAIPGVNKFGKKASLEFFEKYKSFEEAESDNFSKLGNRSRNAILNDLEGYRKSKFLATLHNVPNFGLQLTSCDKEVGILLRELECRSLGSDFTKCSWDSVNYKLFGLTKTPTYREQTP